VDGYPFLFDPGIYYQLCRGFCRQGCFVRVAICRAGAILLFSLFLGYIMEERQIRIKILFIPYYFCVMNYAVMAGIIRYFTTQQSSVWEKAQRKM
jgi:biofilm PGA synthesis N-glycosyltransferase PgaC